MSKDVNGSLERKITTSEWIIKTRWIYMVAVLLIGVLTKTISHSNVGFPFATMVLLFIIFGVINLILYFAIKKVQKNFSKGLLTLINYVQIILELVFFIIIMHSAGGVESISTVFFFMPVVSASLIFGYRGSIVTAIVAGVLINLLVVAEYYGIIAHIPRYDVTTIEFQNLSIALTKTVTTAIFYIIVGSFSGYSAKILFEREALLKEKGQQLNEQTKELAQHSEKLIASNQELDNKVAELERFEKQVVGRELKMIELKKEITRLTENNQK
ncbi:MAG: hypothetical protein WCW93_01775 [Candidatus Paceibacterota bacterium]